MKLTVPCGDDKLCEQCRHFYRHYTRIKEHHYHPIAMGHCVHPRVKPRMVDSPACDRFFPRPEETGDCPSCHPERKSLPLTREVAKP